MTKEEIEKKIKEILSKDNRFKDAKIIVKLKKRIKPNK